MALIDTLGTSLSVQLEGQATPRLDAPVGLLVQESEVSLFDMQSQERL